MNNTSQTNIVVTSAQKVDHSFKEGFQLPDYVEHFSCYKITDCSSSEQIYNDATKNDAIMGELNKLQSLDHIFEEKVASNMRPLVGTDKALCMIELSDFPYVYTWLDKRDQTKCARNAFSEDFAVALEKTYTEDYPSNNIPVLTLNKLINSVVLNMINNVRSDIYDAYTLKNPTDTTKDCLLKEE